MHSNFLPSTLKSPSAIQPSEISSAESEPLRVMLIGSQKAVINTIHTLHALGFAAVSEWSLLLPGKVPGQVMSILTRRIIIQ